MTGVDVPVQVYEKRVGVDWYVCQRGSDANKPDVVLILYKRYVDDCSRLEGIEWVAEAAGAG